MLTVTQALQNFLIARKTEANADLIARWSRSMETQVNVSSRGGEPVEGKPNRYRDEQFEWWNIRVPRNANSKPEWHEYEMSWPLDLYAEAIGSNGWDWKERKSYWLGFDYDSIAGHGTGLSSDQLAEIAERAKQLGYVEVRKSTGGAGLHFYVFVDAIPTANHTIHAALAKAVLAKMSADCKFDFASGIDCLGSILWIWSRKMTSENGGLSLIKCSTQTLTESDLPNWREQIKAQPQRNDGTGAGSDWVAKAMRQVANFGQAKQGERNSSAFRQSGSLSTLPDDAGKLPSETQIYEIVRAWNLGNVPPLDDAELRECVHNGMNNGTPPESKESLLDQTLTAMREDKPKPKPKIVINHELHRMVDEAATALGSAPNTYQYGQALVEVVYDAEKPPQCLHDNGSPQLVVMHSATLATRLSASAHWVRYDAKAKKDEKKWKLTTPPPAVVNAVHVASKWPISTITGIVSCPVLRADGTILTQPGYDDETGLYLENGDTYPALMKPAEAIALLLDVVHDFQFETDAHRSSWLAFLITLLVRPAFAGNSPLFLFDANAPGTGKGLITDLTTMIVEGRKACRYSWSSDDSETRKLITTVGVSGAPYLIWDNVTGKLGGSALEKMMTTGIWADRVLGLNRQVTFPIRFIPAATANNAALTTDMIRRTCHCKQRTDLENPAERTGFRYPDLLSHVKQHRHQLVMAALSIPSAYIKAGCPDQKLPTWGSYEQWSELVRGSIVWAGQPDPGDTREGLKVSADDDTAIMRAILAAWPAEPVTVAKALNLLGDLPDLAEAIAELPERHRSERLGKLLKNARGRVINGKRLQGSETKPVKWSVTPA